MVEKKFNDNKNTLSCQNSMSLYLKRELVIGRECGDERGRGTRSDRDGGSPAG